MVDSWRFIRKAKDLYSWYSFAAGVSALLVAGIGLAIGGAVWLVAAGIQLPLALMAGFCTLVGAVYLAMAPFAYRALFQVAAIPKRERKKPNYVAIRLQHKYTLGPASRLELDPNTHGTHESQAWYETFVSAIQQGKLRFLPKKPHDRSMIEHEKINPSWDTTITREEFKRYAASINENPPFLRDK
jgi:hypothetical protein